MHFYVKPFFHSKGVTDVGVAGENICSKFEDIMGKSKNFTQRRAS